MFRDKCAKLRWNVPWVKPHRYNQTHLYPKLKGYIEIMARKKMWSSWCSTYCTHFRWCDVHKLRMSVIESRVEPSEFVLRLHTRQLSLLQLTAMLTQRTFCPSFAHFAPGTPCIPYVSNGALYMCTWTRNGSRRVFNGPPTTLEATPGSQRSCQRCVVQEPTLQQPVTAVLTSGVHSVPILALAHSSHITFIGQSYRQLWL
jgi:hypothetical protein